MDGWIYNETIHDYMTAFDTYRHTCMQVEEIQDEVTGLHTYIHTYINKYIHAYIHTHMFVSGQS